MYIYCEVFADGRIEAMLWSEGYVSDTSVFYDWYEAMHYLTGMPFPIHITYDVMSEENDRICSEVAWYPGIDLRK